MTYVATVPDGILPAVPVRLRRLPVAFYVIILYVLPVFHYRPNLCHTIRYAIPSSAG
jgi:hypothetical protein